MKPPLFHILYIAILGFFCSMAVYPADTGDSVRPLQLADYLDWEWVSNPQISPDGKTILYTRKHINIQQDRYDSELWVMDADGKRNRRLLGQAVNEIAWSPDSTRIAYVAGDENGNNEVFVRVMNENGEVTQLTDKGAAPSKLSWSPDGERIAFRALVSEETTSAWDITLPSRPEGANWAEDALVIDRLHWQQEGVGLKPKGYTHIFVVSAHGGAPRQVTEGNWNVGERYAGGSIDFSDKLEWSPDGKSIVFSAYKEPDADLVLARSSLYTVDVLTRALRRITVSPEFAIKPKISPDGKRIAYIGMDNTTASNFPTPQLHVINVDGTNDRILVDDMHDNQWWADLHWSRDSNGIYYVYGLKGTYNVHYVALSGEKRDITSGAQSLVLSSISNQGVAVGTRTTGEEPGDVVRFDLTSGRKLQRLTAVNDDVLQDIKLSRIEEIWYNSTENTRVQGWLVYPPDFNPKKQYPLLLDIHGGPEGMYTGDFHFSALAFSFQVWAAQGYVVLYTNPRGSTGYGSDFARAIYNAYPGRRDYEDLMHGVDEVIRRGFIDEERLYVEGCSGGGILTAWVVTQTDRFAGAAALCPAVNMISKAGTMDVPSWGYKRFKDYFWDDPSAWLEHSAIMRVNQVKTPTLIMAGENDRRISIGQSQEFYSALKILGVPTKLILLKDAGHAGWLLGGGRPSNFLRAQLYMRKWFSEWQRVEKDGEAAWAPSVGRPSLHP